MLPFRLFLLLLLALVLPALSGCYGDAADTPATHAAALRAAVARPASGSAPPAAPRRRALGVPGRDASPLTPAALFAWAEQAFAGHFPGPQPTQTLAPYSYRHYPATGNYLAVAEGNVYVLGAFTQNEVLRVGLLEDFHCDVLPADCVPPALTLSPATLSATWLYGNPGGVTVDATATDPAAFTGDLYLYIVDGQGVLQNHVSLSVLGTGRYRAGIAGTHLLPLGHHQGTFLIQLCRDADCQQEYAGSPVRLPYDFHVVAQRLDLSFVGGFYERTVHQGALGANLEIEVNAPAGAWAASSPTPWLRVDTPAGNGRGRLVLSLLTQNLPLGAHLGELSVTSADGQRQTVAVPVRVIAAEAFKLNSQPLNFQATQGAVVAPQPVFFDADRQQAVPWTARASVPWLSLSPGSGVTPGTVAVQPLTAGLAAGTHHGTVLVTAPGMAELSVPVSLTLTRASLSATLPGAALPTTAPVLTFGGASGSELATQTLLLKLDTGSTTWPWTLRDLPPWLNASATQGRVDAAGTQLSFTPNPAALGAGVVSATGRAVIAAQIHGEEVTLPVSVSLQLAQRSLLPSLWGVALSSTPAGAVLARSLRVDDSLGAADTWSAKSSASWLKVTASGPTGVEGALTLSAEPASLPAGTLSQATVTISSGTAGVQPVEVKVALWKGSGGAAALTRLAAASQNSFPFPALAADPIRPYFYTSETLTLESARVNIFHAHSGQKVGSIPVPGARIVAMAASPDGARLYALDVFAKTMFVLDLAGAKLLTSWPLEALPSTVWSELGKMHVLRPGGTEIVLLDTGEAYLASGKSLGQTGLKGALAITADGRQAYLGRRTMAGAHLARFGLAPAVASGGGLLVTPLAEAGYDANQGVFSDLALGADAARLYGAESTLAGCGWATLPALSIRNGTATEGGTGLRVSVGSDGRVLCALKLNVYEAPGSTPDITISSASGALLRSLRVSPPTSSGFAPAVQALLPAADGLVFAVLLSNHELVLVANPR
ncbi:MAG: BACON domain-containing protein [Burkholderiales bacterium]|nr:BACON domain-containing protein [Burkholderiales bacterium]